MTGKRKDKEKEKRRTYRSFRENLCAAAACILFAGAASGSEMELGGFDVEIGVGEMTPEFPEVQIPETEVPETFVPETVIPDRAAPSFSAAPLPEETLPAEETISAAGSIAEEEVTQAAHPAPTLEAAPETYPAPTPAPMPTPYPTPTPAPMPTPSAAPAVTASTDGFCGSIRREIFVEKDVLPGIMLECSGSVAVLSLRADGKEIPWRWEGKQIVPEEKGRKGENRVELVLASMDGKPATCRPVKGGA